LPYFLTANQPKAKTGNNYGKSQVNLTFNTGRIGSSIPISPTHGSSSLDLDKLYYGFAINESSLPGKKYPCATPWHAAARNCVSLKRNNKLIQFASIDQSKAAWKSLWIRSYGGGLPNYQLMWNYTCGPHAKTCPGAQDSLNVVMKYYNLKIINEKT
jgi:hypothetical protein